VVECGHGNGLARNHVVMVVWMDCGNKKEQKEIHTYSGETLILFGV